MATVLDAAGRAAASRIQGFTLPEISMNASRTCLTLLAMVSLAVQRPRAAERPARQTLDADGVKIRYAVEGQGEPVVLIHGWLSSAAMNWDLPGTTALLAKEHQVITYDVRGHGQSDKPTEEKDYGPELVQESVALARSSADPTGPYRGLLDGGRHCRKLHRQASGPGPVRHARRHGLAERRRGRPMVLLADRPAHAGRRRDASLRPQPGQAGAHRRRDPVDQAPGGSHRGRRRPADQRLYVEPLEHMRKDWPIVEIENANHIGCVAKPEFRAAIAAWLKKNGK